MTRAITLIFCVTLLGCVSKASPRAAQRNEIIQAAISELNERRIKIPKDCMITVVEWVTVSAIQRPRESYLVRFDRSHSGERKKLYAVVIDKHSKKASEFLDYRGLTAGGRKR